MTGLLDCVLAKNRRRPFTASCFQGDCIQEVKVKVLFVLGKNTHQYHIWYFCSTLMESDQTTSWSCSRITTEMVKRFNVVTGVDCCKLQLV